MTGNPTPHRLRILDQRRPLMGFPELLESDALTATERLVYLAMALKRLEAGRRDLAFAATPAVEMGSRKPAAA
jgi:hypothetical protein